MKTIETANDFYRRFTNDNALPGKFNVYKNLRFPKDNAFTALPTGFL